MDVTQARWRKSCINRQINSARSNGEIGRWGRMSVKSAKMAMEKYKVVITENEIDAETHGMGATEENVVGVAKRFWDAEARIEPKPGKKSKPIAHDRSIFIALVSLCHLPIRDSEAMLLVIIVTDSKLGGFEICCFALAKIQSPSDTGGTVLPPQKHFDERTTESFVSRRAAETEFR
jgi:hypothetical protein